MRKIVYVAGVGHSGSTILNIALGGHSQLIGLGEMINIIKADQVSLLSKAFNEVVCSCGKNMYHCEFWSKAKNILLENAELSLEQKLDLLIKYFYSKYSNEKIIIDSSKIIGHNLKHLHRNYDLYIIFLVRDFRSWIYSRQCRLGKNLIFLSFKWLKQNIGIKKRLVANNYNFINIGYEEFALYPEFVLKKICDFIGIEYQNGILNLSSSKSHVIRGNVSRGDPQKKNKILYDARWLTSQKIVALGLLFLPIIKWNQINVYSNIIIGNTHAFGVRQKDFIYFGDKRKEKMLEILKEK